MSMVIKVKYADGDVRRLSIIPNGDWIDLASAEDVNIKKGDFKLISLGVAMELPDDYEAHVVPRSSTFKKYGIIMTNSIGIIDNSYCGNEDIWRFPALCMRESCEIKKGDRIAQFRIVKKMENVSLDETDDLGNQNRGGFGSTGVR